MFCFWECGDVGASSVAREARLDWETAGGRVAFVLDYGGMFSPFCFWDCGDVGGFSVAVKRFDWDTTGDFTLS